MSINDRLTEHLNRGTVGFPTALASTIGLIMASPVILTATMGFGIGGSAFAVAMLIAVVMMLAQATSAMETTRIEASRQTRYLSIAVQPVAADDPTYPRAFENTLVVMLIFAGIYLMVSMTVAILREQVSA